MCVCDLASILVHGTLFLFHLQIRHRGSSLGFKLVVICSSDGMKKKKKNRREIECNSPSSTPDDTPKFWATVTQRKKKHKKTTPKVKKEWIESPGNWNIQCWQNKKTMIPDQMKKKEQRRTRTGTEFWDHTVCPSLDMFPARLPTAVPQPLPLDRLLERVPAFGW